MSAGDLRVDSAVPGVSIERVGELPAEWDALVAADPGAGFFQSRRWLAAVLTAWPDARPHLLLARRNDPGGSRDREVLGGVVAIERGRGLLRRIHGLPQATHGGPVMALDAPGGWGDLSGARPWVDDGCDAWFGGTALGGALVTALFEGAQAAEVRLVDASGAGGDRVTVCPGAAGEFPTTRLLDLESSLESLWRECGSGCRYAIKRARRDGWRVQRRGARDMPEIRRLAQIARRERGLALNVPNSLLAALESGTDGPWGGVDVWVGLRDGGAVEAALLNLRHGHRAQNYMAVASEIGRKGGVQNLLHWSAIEHGSEAGVRVYDFGASPGLPRVERFKASFGAQEFRVRHWRWRSPHWRALVALRAGLQRCR